MNNRFDSIIETLSKAGFVDSSAAVPKKSLDFKITEYLRSLNSGINEERIENTLNDFNIDANKFFYVNFFEKVELDQQ